MFRALVGAAVGLLFASQALAQTPRCAPHGQIVMRLAVQYQERLLFEARQDGFPLEIWVNLDTGTWTVLSVLPDGNACVSAHGIEFQPHTPSPGDL